MLSVETVTTSNQDDKKDSKSVNQTQVSLITDAGELRTFRLSPATGVRLLEHDVNQEVGRYLALLSSTRASDVRKMTISTAGSGERQVMVSYISECRCGRALIESFFLQTQDALPFRRAAVCEVV